MAEKVVDLLEKISAVKGEEFVEGLVAGIELASASKETEKE